MVGSISPLAVLCVASLHQTTVESFSILPRLQSILGQQAGALVPSQGSSSSETSQAGDLLRRVDDVLESKGPPFDRNETIRLIDLEHVRDTEMCASLGHGKAMSQQSGEKAVSVKNITILGERIGVLTNDDLLNASSVELIRNCATNFWQLQKCTSRFTYQRASNKEAHLVDLCKESPELLPVITELLSERIYPLAQTLFPDCYPNDSIVPCVYDSLLIRYNSTEADNPLGAGQPLHRDQGLISVNIKLNSEFQGGGTFMDAQLASRGKMAKQPIKPEGVGRAFLHKSSQRHAGAAIESGVRDILVIFLTATNIGIKADSASPPVERATRLKGMHSLETDHWLLANYNRMALDCVQTDSEAWHYLGMSLYFLSATEDCDVIHGSSLAHLAVDVLNVAIQCNPNDARLYNSLALGLGRTKADPSLIQAAFQKGLKLHKLSEEVGCDVKRDLAALAYNYGLFMMGQGRFEEAFEILQLIDTESEKISERIVNDVLALLEYCEHQAFLSEKTDQMAV
uniref:Fe2OG dioxygenase domain-containing protein n=1 Tax=Pseudictyota dubia TaxID=2749911 RepID=A0A7R9Z211_9STRA|mmetsp:Transcript_20236/g.38045  ORF Transcript_20236/g.38045 Transcript_20236/m.38045 type:complete len:514 (+) Transcript_20236:89-1630(+)